MNIYDCAIAMEQDARRRYEELAGKVALPELKNLFTLLAQAEEEHHRHLTALKEGANGDGNFGALDEAACLFRGLVGQREAVAALKKDPDLYRHVLDHEEESIRFYEELAEKAVRDGEKAQLLRLAEEERRHLSVVENIYAFLESPRTFLAWGEFANLDQL
jgi:rubrerythrin